MSVLIKYTQGCAEFLFARAFHKSEGKFSDRYGATCPVVSTDPTNHFNFHSFLMIINTGRAVICS